MSALLKRDLQLLSTDRQCLMYSHYKIYIRKNRLQTTLDSKLMKSEVLNELEWMEFSGCEI
jgi:hypothetical protein